MVSADEAGWRLDRVLAVLPRVTSRRRAREALESGKVAVDGRPCGPEDGGRALDAGARVVVTWNRPGTSHVAARARQGLRDADVRVIYEDDVLVAVDKPPGLLTDTADRVQAQERDSLSRRLRAWLRSQGDDLHVVHRIDRDTSGVVLVARTEEAAQDLFTQFREHAPERVYHAWIHGVLDPPRGQWGDWMSWDARERIQRKVDRGTEGAVLARARYEQIRTWGEAASLVEVRLHTGRRNQIRVHLQVRHCPLLGETLYLPPRWEDPGIGAPRQALHALRLTVTHPKTRLPITFEAPVPEDLLDLERRLTRLKL